MFSVFAGSIHTKAGADPGLMVGGDGNQSEAGANLKKIIVLSEKPYEIKEILVWKLLE